MDNSHIDLRLLFRYYILFGLLKVHFRYINV